MTRPRTTARVFLLAAILGLTAGPAAARLDPGNGLKRTAAPKQKSDKASLGKRIIFPVLGRSRYGDDYGDPRGQGRHDGIDIIAPRKALAVAAEAGRVEFHVTSSRAGCMLYLHGASGTTYLYIHLNNDLTAKNDNRGKCVAGTAYWKGLKNGARVEAGQPIAYNGNSGDADQAGYHLHFEVHPGGGSAVSPFPYLRKAKKLLFAVQPGADFTAAIRGNVVTADPVSRSLTLNVDRVQSWPGGLRVTDVKRP